MNLSEILDNVQEGHHLLNSATGQAITRRYVTPVPLTRDIIDIAHKMKNKGGMTEELKITTKNIRIFYILSRITGVNFGEGTEEDETETEISDYTDHQD